MKKWALAWLALVVTVLGVVSCAAVSFQDRLVFFPTHDEAGTPADAGHDYEDVWIDSGDHRIHGWFVEQTVRDETRGTVLFFHGNAGNITHRLETVSFWVSSGFDIFIFDYSGYGKSEGKPGEKQAYEDAEAAWTWLTTERGVPPGEILVHARSLGGGISSWLVERHRPAAWIVESTFTSIPDVATEIYPWAPRWLVRVKMPTLERLDNIDCPTLFAHSFSDEVIPYNHGRRLFADAHEPKRFMGLTGGHSGGWTQTRDYPYEVESFLVELGGFPKLHDDD